MPSSFQAWSIGSLRPSLTWGPCPQPTRRSLPLWWGTSSRRSLRVRGCRGVFCGWHAIRLCVFMCVCLYVYQHSSFWTWKWCVLWLARQMPVYVCMRMDMYMWVCVHVYTWLCELTVRDHDGAMGDVYTILTHMHGCLYTCMARKLTVMDHDRAMGDVLCKLYIHIHWCVHMGVYTLCIHKYK